MFEKDGSAGTLCPIIMAKCGFGGARPPGEPPSMTQPWKLGLDEAARKGHLIRRRCAKRLVGADDLADKRGAASDACVLMGGVMATRHGLGRGLGALISEDVANADAVPAGADIAAVPGVTEVALDKIRPNPRQPRTRFDQAALDDLANSIREHGVLQPLLVRAAGDYYELVAGERRLRAARLAGLSQAPVLIRAMDDRAALEIALIENLQREDLNPIEEAEGYRQLCEQFALSQEDVARRVGKARATVANALRLLDLPDPIRLLLTDGRLSAGHAKALLSVPIDEEKCLMARRAVAEGWSVRLLEKAVAQLARTPRKPRASRADMPALHLQDLTDKLRRHFGTAVQIVPSRTLANGKKMKGRVEIEFYSNDELSRVLELLGLAETF